jgi:hypothetical protein
MKSRKTLKGHMGNTGNKINILLGTDIYILYSIPNTITKTSFF